MFKLKMMIDKTPFTNKPNEFQIPKIKDRFKDNSTIVEVTLEELADCIKKGYTIAPCVARNGLKNENFISSQLIILDIDNKDTKTLITPEMVIKKLKDNGFEPYLYHESFSYTDEVPKFHVLLVLDEPINEVNKMTFAIKTFLNCIDLADQACKDVARMYFTTNGQTKKIVTLNLNARVTWEDIIKYANNLEQKSSTKTYKRNKKLRDLEKNFDLLSLMKEKNTPIYGENSNSNYVMFDECCICGHKRCLCYFKDSNKFYCFGAHGGISGYTIDYIKYSENKTEKEAIDKFCDLVGITKEDDTFENKRNYFINIIKDQMLEIDFECNNIESLTWIEQRTKNNGEIYYSVNAPNLSKFFRENVAYFFVKNYANGAILRYFYIKGYYQLKDDNELKGYIKSLIPLELQKVAYVNEVYNLLITDLKFIPIENLNVDEDIINFENGVYHLSSGEITPHSKKYISTIRIPCDYKENVEKPVTGYFDKYMSDLTNNNSDLKKMLLQAMGMALSNVYAYRCKQFFICVGAHNTGKSKLKSLLTELIGKDNCSSIDLIEMESRFGKVDLLNKRLVGSNDMSFTSIPDICTLKQATGGDLIPGEYKVKNGFINFVFKGLIWFCTNEIPTWDGDKNSGVYDRMNIIKCDNVIPEEARDAKLVEHLLEEKEYIVSLAVNELKNVITNGYRYNIPEICYKWKEKFKVKNNPVLQFIDECITERTELIIKDNYTTTIIYRIYREWFKQNGIKGKCQSKGEVYEWFKKTGKGERIKRNHGYWYFEKLTLNDEAKKEYSYICGVAPPTESLPEYENEDLPF